MTSFAGKVLVVTGGGAGIGMSVAARMAEEGAAIAIADIDLVAAQAAVDALGLPKDKAMAVECDVADETSVEKAIDNVAASFGGVDLLLNNAGKHLMEHAVAITALPREKWRRMLDVNILGIINCAAACRPYMAARGGGVIVNMGSIAGLTGHTAYGVSKLAVRGLTVGLANEFANDGIRVCAIAPGLVDTPSAMAEIPIERQMTFVQTLQLVKRPGRMADVAAAARFLFSDEASFITGETLTVGGGYPLHI